MRSTMATFLLKQLLRRPLQALRVVWSDKRPKRFHPSDCLDIPTRVWNRTTIQDLAELEIRATNRHWSRISVVLIRLNAGDEDRLHQMAEALRRLVRPQTHLVGKWSASEFVVCLLDADQLTVLDFVGLLGRSCSVPFSHGISSHSFPLAHELGFSDLVTGARKDMLAEGDWQPFVC